MNNLNSNIGFGGDMSAWVHGHGLLLLVVALWSIFWKGLALWRSARRGQPWWFFFMLIINSLGILEIIYLFAVAKVKPSELFRK